MSDTESAAAGNGQNQQQPVLNVLAQYIKDLSFENPNVVKSCGCGSSFQA